MARFPTELAGLPAAHGARLVVLAHCDDAVKAQARLKHHDDPEALHDFRVALRRTRSTLEAYGSHLRGAQPRKLRRRLAKLQKSTNASRDAEVQLDWLTQRRSQLAPTHQSGWRWLVTRLEAIGLEGRRFALHGRFANIVRQLRRRMRTYQAEVEPSKGVSFATAAARRLRRQAKLLRRHLSEIVGASREAEAHAARIVGKQLRYLLEPFAAADPRVRGVLRQLKSLQDLLGELHDTQVLTATLGDALERAAAEHARQLHQLSQTGTKPAVRSKERAGLLALTRLLAAEREALFDGVAERWLGPAAEPFFEQLQEVVESLERHRRRRRARTFILRALPESLRQSKSLQIEQGWIEGAHLQESLRRTTTPHGDQQLLRTITLSNGAELSEESSQRLFDQLWPLTEGKRIQISRFVVEQSSHTWRIDAFADRNLLLATGAPAKSLEIPSWLEPHIEREVTGDQTFTDLTLPL